MKPLSAVLAAAVFLSAPGPAAWAAAAPRMGPLENAPHGLPAPGALPAITDGLAAGSEDMALKVLDLTASNPVELPRADPRTAARPVEASQAAQTASDSSRPEPKRTATAALTQTAEGLSKDDSPGGRQSLLGRLFGGSKTPGPGADLQEDLAALTESLKGVEGRYFSSSSPSQDRAETDLGRAKALAKSSLEKISARAQAAAQPKGPRAWVEGSLTWFLGELREKIDFRETWRGLKKLLVTEGKWFAAYAVAIEAVEDLVVPGILIVIGHPEFIPFALGFHTEPVLYPIYFMVRLYLWRRTLWRLAGGRANYLRLKDFRAKLMNEDPARRVERVFLSGFPSASLSGEAMINVNRSKLPVWVPLFLRNLYDRNFRWYDLYISVNELAILAPRAIVRILRGLYKEYPRAAAYVLLESILQGPPQARSRLIQNLAFKYWLNLGFADFQPTLLPFLDERERALAELNQSRASRFFLRATPEEARTIKALISDYYAWTALQRSLPIPPAEILEVMAPFLPDNYPARSLSPEALAASSPALARVHFLLTRLLEQKRLKNGDSILLGGRPVAVIAGGGIEYLGKVGARMEKALLLHATALNGAAEYLEQSRPQSPQYDPFAETGRARQSLDFAASIQAPEPQLLNQIYWLKQAFIPDRIDALTALRQETASGIPGWRAWWAYKSDMAEQISKLRKLRRRLEKLEFSWLKDYYAHRFSGDENKVPSYGERLREVQEAERAARVAADIGESLSRRPSRSPVNRGK